MTKWRCWLWGGKPKNGITVDAESHSQAREIASAHFTKESGLIVPANEILCLETKHLKGVKR